MTEKYHARLANADPMQVGRIPERLGKTGILPAGRVIARRSCGGSREAADNVACSM